MLVRDLRTGLSGLHVLVAQRAWFGQIQLSGSSEALHPFWPEGGAHADGAVAVERIPVGVGDPAGVRTDLVTLAKRQGDHRRSRQRIMFAASKRVKNTAMHRLWH